MAKEVRIAAMAPSMPEEMRYRAQDAMHTIARAEAHKRDGELMKHVRALANDVHRAVGAGPRDTKPKASRDPAAQNKGAGKAVAKAQGKRPKASKLAKVPR